MTETTPADDAVPTVLVVDDQVGEVLWLLDDIRHRGCEAVVVGTEEAAREQLQAVAEGKASYLVAIFDVMVAVKDLWQLIVAGEDADDKFFADSRDTGLRLCAYARKELGIGPETLPIACLTVRDDPQVKKTLAKLRIPLFSRIAEDTGSIRSFLDEHLPPRPSDEGER